MSKMEQFNEKLDALMQEYHVKIHMEENYTIDDAENEVLCNGELYFYLKDTKEKLYLSNLKGYDV